jgi:hypothetical protein
MRRVGLAVVLVFCVLAAGDSRGCPFCNASGTTLTQDATSAGLILFGTTKNPRLDPKEPGQGATDLDIEVVIKSHEILGDKKVITLPRYIPQIDPKQPMKYLVFCDVYKGQLDPYRGTPFKADSRIAPYLKGSLAIKDKDASTRLKYFFDFLDDPDPEIANDAYTEFGNADYKDFRAAAGGYSVERVKRWLTDAATPASRLGLYGSMLGHCGKAEDAAVLKDLLDDPKRKFVGGIDGVMAGYTMLNPKEGWARIADTLGDPKREFLVRYAALRAARFLWEFRPDLVDRDELAAKVAVAIDQSDVSDLIIEDLRKWGYWQAADKILAALKRPGHDAPIIRRATVRFMLSCPPDKCPAAAAFIAEQREKNPKWVEEVESLLASETLPVSQPTPPAKAP